MELVRMETNQDRYNRYYPIVITSEMTIAGEVYWEAQFENWYGHGVTPNGAYEALLKTLQANL